MIDRIALAFENAQWAREVAVQLPPRFDVAWLGGDRLVDAEADLLLLDPPALERFETAIRARRLRSAPVLRPFLLVCDRQDLGEAASRIPGAVDDVILRPLEAVELEGRVDLLLRARALSLRHQETDRLKDELFSALSHELLTPLTFVVGSASLLLDEVAGPLTADQRRLVAGIDEGAGRIHGLINNALTLGRLLAGRYELHKGPVVFGRLVEAAIAAAQNPARQRHVALEARIDVPEPVYLDQESMELALKGLVETAVRHGCEGGRVRVDARVVGDSVVAEVAQEGPAIQEGCVSPSGLSLARAIVEAHGGTLGIRGGPEFGNTFWLKVPAGKLQEV